MEMMRKMQARKIYEGLETTLQTLAPEVAIENISRFMQEFPDYPQSHNDLAVLLLQQGELLQALGRFERAVRLAPGNRTYRKNLAGFYFVELGWTDDAILMYTDLLKEDSGDIEVLGALALISCKIDRKEEAGHFLRKILELEPLNSEAQNLLNTLFPKTPTPIPIPKPIPKARRIIPVLTAPEPDADDIGALLADLRQSVADLSQKPVLNAPHESASATPTGLKIAELEARLRDDPANALLNNDLGVLYLDAGNLERSCDHHELAFRYAPQNLLFRKNLAGVCAISAGKMDRAIELLTGGLRNYPADAEILGALAQICIRLGRKEEALTFLRRILDLEPWNQDARALLTQFQEAPGDSFFLNN